MEWADVLLTIAEVSIAFAGFASIVAVLGRREGGGWPTEDVDRFWVMIEYSLAALFFAMVPFALYHLGIREPVLWELASALIAVFLLGYAVMVSRRLIRHRLADAIRSHVLSVGGMFTVCAGLIVLEGLNAVSAPFDEPFGIYLVGILWLLFGAGFMFIRLLSVVRPTRPAEGLPTRHGSPRREMAQESGSVKLSEA